MSTPPHIGSSRLTNTFNVVARIQACYASTSHRPGRYMDIKCYIGNERKEKNTQILGRCRGRPSCHSGACSRNSHKPYCRRNGWECCKMSFAKACRCMSVPAVAGEVFVVSQHTFIYEEMPVHECPCRRSGDPRRFTCRCMSAPAGAGEVFAINNDIVTVHSRGNART